jgi:hypothetical protein
MRKFIFVLASIILIFSVESKAQLGLKIGYNFASQPDKDVTAGYSSKSLNSFHAGVFFDKDLIPLLDVRVGLDYSPKGFKEENGDWYNQVKLNYIELPVLAKVKIGPFYGLGGFYGAYAMNGENKIHAVGSDLTWDVEFDNDEISRWDAGMKFGAGFQFGLGPVHVFTQADYSFGLLNVSTSDNLNFKNNVFGISAGVLLGFE